MWRPRGRRYDPLKFRGETNGRSEDLANASYEGSISRHPQLVQDPVGKGLPLG